MSPVGLFSSELRAPVATYLREDPWGRRRQMAQVCPGVLALASAIETAPGAGERDIVVPLLEGIDAGLRLGPLLDVATKAWVRASTQRLQHAAYLPGWGPTFEWQARLDGREPYEPDELQRKRALLRRAGPRVAVADLLSRPPLAFAVEDIPDGTRLPHENARWFALMHGRPELVGGLPTHDRDAAEAVARFVSARGLALAPTAPLERQRELIGHIVAYARESGRRPGRRSDPVKLWRRAERWRRDHPLHRGTFGSMLARARAERRARSIVPPAPIPTWRRRLPEGELHVEPLHDYRAIVEASQSFSNCLQSLVDATIAGRTSLYLARWQPAADGDRAPPLEALHVEVRHRPHAPIKAGATELLPPRQLGRVAGPENRPASPGARKALAVWLDAHDIECPPGSGEPGEAPG